MQASAHEFDRTSSTATRAERRPGNLQLVIFAVGVLALTWAVWVPRAAGVDVGVLGPLSTWAPAVTAVACAAAFGGRCALRDLGLRLTRWRVGWRWYVAVLVGPPFCLLVAGCGMLIGLSWPQARPAVLTTTAAGIALTFLALLLTDGLGEEVAWRGYALPRLLSQQGMIAASLLLGVFWWLWHLPLLYTAGAVLEGEPAWLLLADLLAKSLIFTLVFLHTRGSLLMAIVLHAATNLWAVSPAPGPDGDLTLALLALALKWLLVGWLLRATRDRTNPLPR